MECKETVFRCYFVNIDHYGFSGMVTKIKVVRFPNLKLLSMCDVRLNSIEGLCHVYMPQL